MRDQAAAVIALLLAVACGGGEEDGTGGGGGLGGAGGEGAIGGAGGMEVPPAIHPGVLVDEGLVARYFIDEAADGQGPLELVDAAPNPLNLAMTYVNADGPELTFFEDEAGNRGLRSIAVGLDDKASILVDGTKIYDALQGSSSMTYEAVVTGTAFSSSGTRFIHLGKDQDHTLTLETSTPTRVSSDNHEFGEGVLVDLSLGRVIIHAVMDTSLADPVDRYRIYINGGLAERVEGAAPPLGHTLELGTERELVVANRKDGGRTGVGTVFYAAVYSAPLSAEQVAQNAALLLLDDDTPE